jgi:hypothetical protein
MKGWKNIVLIWWFKMDNYISKFIIKEAICENINIWFSEEALEYLKH